MPGQCDDVPFAILFPDEKALPNAPILAFLPNSQELYGKQTITHLAGGFGMLNLHDLNQLPVWNIQDFHVGRFASQQDLHLA
jgi:hypothetical protein